MSTDDEAANIARAMRKLAEVMLEKGDTAGAAKYLERAERLLGGHEKQLDTERSTVQVDSTMIDARSSAIAEKAAGRNKLLKAIAEDAKGPGGKPRWGSATRYCKQRLGCSPGSLTGWMSGEFSVPRDVVAKVAKDFPGLDWTWKKIREE